MLPRLLALLLVPGLVLVAPGPVQAGAAERDPRLERELYVSHASQPYLAAQQDHRFDPIGLTAMAHWVTGAHPRHVKKHVRAYASAAERAGETPVVVLYAIPGRDCGGYSAGGLTPRQYSQWVGRVAAALRGTDAMAILEPDALGHLGDCEGQGRRTQLLSRATKKLAKAGVWVYLDAGHSGWVDPQEMAARLARAGVRHARGFSVNVSNFVRTDLEERYAKQVLRALRGRDIDGKHFVVDTSRNGNGETDGADWCNPLDARLGQQPEVVGGRKLDAYLWVKAPGESDGTCNGGPEAGAWWPDYALRLMGLL